MACRPTGRKPRSPRSRHQAVVHPGRVLGRDVQLPAELADVGDPDGEHRRVTDVDVLRGQVPERVVGQVGVGQLTDQLPRRRALHGQQGGARGDVGDGDHLAVAASPA